MKKTQYLNPVSASRSEAVQSCAQRKIRILDCFACGLAMTKHAHYAVFILCFIALTVSTNSTAQAFTYTPENISTTYHEAPSSFAFDEFGQAVGMTISGIPFRQRNIANGYDIRLQRFEIGLAYWYVSDRGVIWAQSDLEALSIYLSRVV